MARLRWLAAAKGGQDKMWKMLTYIGGGCVCFFFAAGVACQSASGSLTDFLLGLVGAAVMAVFTILCAIADHHFGKKE